MRISASFDDLSTHDLRLAELMDKYNVPTIFYWPLNRIDQPFTLNLDDCQQIAKKFEIGSHTLTHALLTRIPLKEAEKEIYYPRLELKGIFGQEIESFCYPRGYANDNIRQLVRNSGYTNARNTLVGVIEEAEDPIWTSTAVHVGIWRHEYKTMGWLEYAKNKLEEAKETDGVFHLWGHGEEIERYNEWDNLSILLKEISKHV